MDHPPAFNPFHALPRQAARSSLASSRSVSRSRSQRSPDRRCLQVPGFSCAARVLPSQRAVGVLGSQNLPWNTDPGRHITTDGPPGHVPTHHLHTPEEARASLVLSRGHSWVGQQLDQPLEEVMIVRGFPASIFFASVRMIRM